MADARTPARAAATTLASAAALGAGSLAWSLVEARWYALREATVPVLAAGERPLRVLHVSDLHLTPSRHRLIGWVRDLDRLDPHLVVDTGDNWAHPQAAASLWQALGPLLDRHGVFVLGSNDYFAPRPRNPLVYLRDDARSRRPAPAPLPWQALVARLTAAGWADLDGARATLDVDGRRIACVGTDDAHLDRDRMPTPGPADPDVDLHLGVTHAPYRRVLDELTADGADLILAGHTHGGQVAVPGLGALTTNCDLDRRRAKGLHGWPGPRPDRRGGGASTWLHVSAGLGTSPYTPIRFACRPEATLLTLVPVGGG